MLEGYEVGISNNLPALQPRDIQVGGYYDSLYDRHITDCDEKNNNYKVLFVRQFGSGIVCTVVGNKPIF